MGALFPRLKSARFDEADILRLAEEMTRGSGAEA
jgi:hypothetical protein